MSSPTGAFSWLSRKTAVTLSVLAISLTTHTAAIEPAQFSALKWRNVGPHRAGRVSAVSGAIGQTGVFYMGMVLGGVWKTTSAGTTWYPIFDDIKDVSSIGSIEVAPSDPNVVYVGTGSTGDGTNRSTPARPGDTFPDSRMPDRSRRSWLIRTTPTRYSRQCSAAPGQAATDVACSGAPMAAPPGLGRWR